MKEKILELLKSALPDVDLTSTKLVDDGTLDSVSLTTVVGELSVEFDIEIPYEELVPENFNSVEAMAALVEKLS